MALRTAETAKTETDANKPDDTATANSSTVTDIDAEVVRKTGLYIYSTEISLIGVDTKGVITIEQPDKSTVILSDLLDYIGKQGYNCAHEVYYSGSDAKIKVKLSWG